MNHLAKKSRMQYMQQSSICIYGETLHEKARDTSPKEYVRITATHSPESVIYISAMVGLIFLHADRRYAYACSTVITTFPRACPSSRYRKAAAASPSG